MKTRITDEQLDAEVIRLAQQNGVDIEEVDREFVRERMEQRAAEVEAAYQEGITYGRKLARS